MRPRRAYHRTNAPLFGEQPLHHIALWRVRHRHGLDVIHHVLADAAQVDLEPRGGGRRLLVAALAAVLALADTADAAALLQRRLRAATPLLGE